MVRLQYAMICNIDAKGRRYRGIGGIACLVGGAILIAASLVWRESFWPLLLSGGCIALCGVFQIFESWKGWCAFRAMGLKTPW